MATKREKLLISIVSQMNVTNINWEKVRADIDVPTKSAAQKQWHYFRKSLQADGLAEIEIRSYKKRESSMSTPGSKRKRQSRRMSNGTKRVKLEFSDDEDDELMLNGVNGNIGQEGRNHVEAGSPVRKNPTRVARVLNFTEMGSECEDNDAGYDNGDGEMRRALSNKTGGKEEQSLEDWLNEDNDFATVEA